MERTAWIALIVVVVVTAGALLFRQKGSPGAKIRLGATFPLTGEVASYGQKAKRGIEMAVEERNAAGGVLGRNVIVDFQDDRHDTKTAVSIFTKFATIDKVPIVFGSAGSSVSLALAPLASRYMVIQVSPISSSAQLSTEGGPFFFRTVPADDLQAEILAAWVFASGKRAVVILFTNNSWGKPLADGFQAKFEALGGKVLLSEGISEGASDFRTVLTKVKGVAGVDALVSPTYPKEGGILVKQAKELGLGVPLFGGDNWGSPEFRTIAGEAAEGVFYTAPAESKSPDYPGFAQRYKAKYGEDPDVFGGYSYDAASTVFKAIEAAGTATDTEKIRQAMASVSFMGVSGPIAFKSNGDLKSEAYDKKTIRSGQVVTVE